MQQENWIDQFYNDSGTITHFSDKQKRLLDLNKPKLLYQYRPINDLNIQNIKNNVIWVRRTSDFNDPYDCLASTNSIKIASTWTSDPVMQKQLKELDEDLKKEAEDLRKFHCVSCFSVNPYSLLMWSHYAGQHRGFCVAYDYDELVKVSREAVVPAWYGKKLNLLRPKTERARTDRIFVRKAIDWSYEEEWRIIALLLDKNSPGRLLKAPKPKKILWGSQVNESDSSVLELKNYCMAESIMCTKLELDEDEYKLNEINGYQ